MAAVRSGAYADLRQPNGVPINKLGVTDAEELEKREGRYGDFRTLHLLEGAVRSTHDAEHLRAIHRHLFSDVYEWAGVMRHEPITLGSDTFLLPPAMAKAGSDTAFARAETIPDRLDDLFTRLREADHFRGLGREAFTAKISDFLIELNAIHPFPEGNGRAQREMVRSIAEGAGYVLDFSVVSQERMSFASEQSLATMGRAGDPTAMIRLIEEISDPVRVAPLRQALDFLTSREFKWQHLYVASTVPGETYDGRLVGQAGPNFMMRRADDAIIVGFAADLAAPAAPGEAVRVTAAASSYNDALARGFETLDRVTAERNPQLAAAHRAMDLVEKEIGRELSPRDPECEEARGIARDMILADLRAGRAHSPSLHEQAVEEAMDEGYGY